MKKTLMLLPLAVVVLGLTWIFLSPSGIDPVAWTPPPPQPLAGPYAENAMLKNIQRLAVGVDTGPTAIAVDAVARVYVGYADGRILRFENGGATYVEVSKTVGRPLAISFDPNTDLAVADSQSGLMHIGVTGDPTPYYLKLDQRARSVTDVERSADDARIFFTDASSKFDAEHAFAARLEHRDNGRLVTYNVSNGRTQVLMSGLAYPTGVTLGPDDAFVLISESNAYRITRYWLKGEKAGMHDVFADQLPGEPGDLSFNGSNRFWVAIPKLRNGTIEAMASKPWLRNVIARLPSIVQGWLNSGDSAGAFLLGYDVDGKLVANLQYHGADGFGSISNVEEQGPWLYLGSRTGSAVGRFPLHDAIAEVPAPLPGTDVAVEHPKETERHDEKYEASDGKALGTAAP